MKPGAGIRCYTGENTDNSPGTGQKQRQPEQRALRGLVPEEDFAKEGLHGVVLTLCWQVCALSFLSLI